MAKNNEAYIISLDVISEIICSLCTHFFGDKEAITIESFLKKLQSDEEHQILIRDKG